MGAMEMLEWAEDDPQFDWVISVLGRGSVEHALGSVYRIIKEQGLEFDYLEMPAGGSWGAQDREPEDGGANYVCGEFHAYGGSREAPGLRERMDKELMRVAEDRAVDIVLRLASEVRGDWRLFCFDMDSTLIQGEVIDELAKMAGVADRVVAITASAMRGEIEFQESFRRRVALLAGLPQSRVQELLGRIPLMEGAERLFRVLKARGGKTAVLSGGFTFFGEYLKERLGVDYVFANELDFDADGYVTGEVRGRIVDGARKAELLLEIAKMEGIPLSQVVAVGDGANDLPMLALAGMGVAFHAKPIVRAKAACSMTHSGLDGLLYLIGTKETSDGTD